ncbi:MAG: YicC/YloC family endoribonuclease [bacterium]
MRSMTGFGSAEVVGRYGNIHVEARSYNHRFLDIRLRVHRVYQSLEPKIFLWTRDRLVRGRVEISVQLTEGKEEGAPFVLNEAVLRFYLEAEKRLREQFGLPGSLDIPAVLGLRDLLVAREETPKAEDEWPLVEQALARAVQELETMQHQEGVAIRADLQGRIDFLGARLAAIREQARSLPGQLRQKLQNRIGEVFDTDQVDASRLAQEIIYYTDKADITEEIVRLSSHLEACRKDLEGGGVTGKRLEFLTQEILREVNTIGSKAGHTDIIHAVVDMKTELEKIRENAQNLQ